MPYYNCKIAEPSGNVNHVKYFADSPEEVRLLVERDGYLLLNIGEVYTISGITKKKFSLRDFLTFNQELYVLIKSGQSVVRALEIILEKLPSGKGLGRVLEGIKKDVEQGHPLSEAMERYPDYFPLLYISNLRAGEKGGNLVDRLRDYQTYMKKVDELRRKIVSASVYPVMILFVILFALIFLLTYVVPNFSKIYLDAQVQLPLATRLLLMLTNVVQASLPAVIIIAVIGIVAFKKYSGTYKGKSAIDGLKLRLPVISLTYSHYLVSNFSRTLSAILKGGIPLVPALKTAAGVSTNQYFSDKLKNAIRLVEEGQSLSSALDGTALFPPISIRLIKAGEGSGGLWEMLDEVAEYYDMLVVDKLTMLTTLVEPALMIFMGLTVGAIVVAMYLPIFSLAGAISG